MVKHVENSPFSDAQRPDDHRHRWLNPTNGLGDWQSRAGGVQSGPFSPDRAANVKTSLFMMQHDSDPGMFSGRSWGVDDLSVAFSVLPWQDSNSAVSHWALKKKKSWLFKCDRYRLSSGTQFQSYHSARQASAQAGRSRTDERTSRAHGLLASSTGGKPMYSRTTVMSSTYSTRLKSQPQSKFVRDKKTNQKMKQLQISQATHMDANSLKHSPNQFHLLQASEQYNHP